MSTFAKYFWVFVLAAGPILEVRASIPWGYFCNLPAVAVFFISLAGNMLPVPFIVVFIRRIFDWMKTKWAWMGKLAQKMEDRAMKKKGMVEKYELFGLVLLVGIPLPGTGAWTGSLIAAMLGLKRWKAYLAIFAGSILAALIVTLVIYGGGSLLFSDQEATQRFLEKLLTQG